ncbi:hypothetical protein UFOVP1004_19 [uncultured Caudovirales phage]|uniref:Uncharacterized protein n=1 Tax=uncultured Caudovirales phage TaxID=2100421 RepID=A0A6J5Q5K2_9CAUD|nr:hypothetical protein UFOVP1004_19 [uncultured Caudovirales phage]
MSLTSTGSVVVNVARLSSGGLACVAEALSWHHGSGLSVPAGAVVQLLWSFRMADGVERWAVLWDGQVVHSIPEAMLEAINVD